MRKLKQEIWPYQITINVTNKDAIDKWCEKNTLGGRFDDWYGYNIDDDKQVYAFKDEATLIVFKLTWGQYGIRKIYKKDGKDRS